jgi:uncharacterized protein DUF1918
MPAKKAAAKAKKTPTRKATAKKATAKARAKKATAKARAKKATAKKATSKKDTTRRTASHATPRASGRSATAVDRASTPATRARRGDLIVVDSAHVGSPAREGEILKVIVGTLSVSYQVRWGDGHETFITPVAGTAHIVRT